MEIKVGGKVRLKDWKTLCQENYETYSDSGTPESPIEEITRYPFIDKEIYEDGFGKDLTVLKVYGPAFEGDEEAFEVKEARWLYADWMIESVN